MFVRTILLIVKRSGLEEQENNMEEEDVIGAMCGPHAEKLKRPTPAYIIYRYYAFIVNFELDKLYIITIFDIHFVIPIAMRNARHYKEKMSKWTNW